MKKTIRKIGDSLGVTLPTKALQGMGVTAGTQVVVIIENGSITLSPLHRRPERKLIADKTNHLIKRYQQTLDQLS